jgi:anaerobic selenocysteine-containing dehydrogenase
MRVPLAAEERMSKALRVVRSVCPHDCPDACGMLAYIEDERIVRVAGDPDHPVTRGAICGKAAKYVERLYSPDRVLYPMRRIGAKGEGRFARITWDEALDLIAGRLREIVDRHGAEAVLPYSFAGTMGIANIASMDRRFFYRLGASQLARTICSAAGSAGYAYTMGLRGGTDPEATADARYIIAWGVNVASTNMHQMTYIQQARRKGATFVVIDVHRNRTASFADWFLHIHPGTDAALALGMMHVIIAERLYDADFVARRTVGFEQLAAHVRDYPPERVAAITGLGREDIVRLARDYARTQPAFIRIGNGLQHHTNGGMAVRAIACLPALVGAWRYPAGGAIKSNHGYAQLNERARLRPDLLAGRTPRTINMNQLGWALTEAEPPVYALIVYNSNPAIVAPDQQRVLAGLARDDLFTVVHEQLHTDTAKYADVLLPATTHFEHTDLYTSYWHLYVQLARPAIAPLGEAKSNVEFFRLLAKRMGFDDPCFDDDVDDIIRQALDNPANPWLRGITLERLEQEPWLRLNIPRDSAPLAEMPLPTPSGKIELYSERLAQEGLPPLPVYEPLPEGTDARGHGDERFPLLFITPPNHRFLNSTYANMPSNVRAEGRPTLEIHPRDAAQRGIADGDLVRVYNARGACQLYAQVTDAVRPGVVVSCGLWWGRNSPDGRGVNATTPQRLADMGGGATFFTNGVEVERVGPAPDAALAAAGAQPAGAAGPASRV